MGRKGNILPFGPATFGDRPIAFLPAWREQLGGLMAALPLLQGGCRRLVTDPALAAQV
jgi:hypothetical protein